MATSSSQPSTHDSTFRPRTWKQITDSFFEVYKPATGRFNLEIVFVHGFRTTSSKDAYYRTWMKGDDSGCWLDTWLVECFPRARIISVSYDSNLTISDTSGRQDMYLIGESLVQSLVKLAEVGQTCSVVLVGHCVGGLVLKHICIWADKFAREMDPGMSRNFYVNFLKYVKGVFFYSTPNLGTDLALRGELDQDAPLRGYLKVFHPEAGRSNEDFRKLRRAYGWRTFGVAASNKTRKRKLMSYLEDVSRSNDQMDVIPKSFSVVEEGSARVDVDEFCSIAGVDHYTICTPSTQESLSFSLLRNFVETIASLQEEFDVELHLSLGLNSTIANLDHRVDHVIEKLQMEKAEQIHLALVGMDGIGKSTLVKQVLFSIGRQFDYTCFVEFEEVPQSEKSRELERLVAQNLRDQNGKRVQLTDGEKPWTRLRRKKLLMIVDDVESEHQINSLLRSSWCGEGSRLVITSSKQNWPRDFIVHAIPFLSHKASCELFEAHVDESVRRSIPKEMVSQAVTECDGLPLTLEVIGEYLRDVKQVDVWAGAISRLHTADSLDGHHDNNIVWRKLKVSFESFAGLEKNIFLDIATFDDLRASKQYSLRIWKNAWAGNRRWDERIIDMGLLNLARRSFLQIQGCEQEQDWQFPDSSTVRIHKQLRQMGKWISAPANEVPSKWRGLWRLKDVQEMLLSQSKDVSKMESQLEDKPQTEVLSISTEQNTPYFENSSVDSNSEDAGSAVHWSSIGNLEKLRLLRILNMRMTGSESDLRLPTHLTLLHMENCTRRWRRGNYEGIWKVFNSVRAIWKVDNHAWPICEEDVEGLQSLAVVMLENCNIVQLPQNFHRLERLKILRIDSGGKFMEPLPKHFGFLPGLEHLELRAPLKNLPNSLLQLSSLQNMMLDGLHIQTLPNPITGNHLTALTRLYLIDLLALTELPDSFGGLVSLRRLCVKGCSLLENLPEGFGNLHQLEKLSIKNCWKLVTLCESFSDLRRLQSLTLCQLPQLGTLPRRFGYLPSLQKLNLSFCHRIQELPESFIELKTIQRLYIYECDALETLWSNFGDVGIGGGLNRLEGVRIYLCKKLLSISSPLEHLRSLRKLTVERCKKFTYVPESLWQLASLVLEYGVTGMVNVLHVDDLSLFVDHQVIFDILIFCFERRLWSGYIYR